MMNKIKSVISLLVVVFLTSVIGVSSATALESAPQQGIITGITLDDSKTSYVLSNGSAIFTSADSLKITTDIGYSIKDEIPTNKDDAISITPCKDVDKSSENEEPCKPIENQTKPFKYDLQYGEYTLLKGDTVSSTFTVAEAKDKPDITINMSNAYQSDGVYYMTSGSSTFSATALSGISSLVAHIDSKEGAVYSSGQPLPSDAHTLIVDAVSNVGISSTKTIKFYVGQDTPSVTLSLHSNSSDYYVSNNTLYFGRAPIVILYSIHNLTGIKNIVLKSDNGSVPINSLATGDISIERSGTYELEVTNNLNITSTYKINSKTVDGAPSNWNKFYSAHLSSDIQTSGDKYTDTEGKKWWKSIDDIRVSSSYKSDVPLVGASSNINNETSIRYPEDKIDDKILIDALHKVSPIDKFKYSVNFMYVDEVNNISTNDRDFYVDTLPPVVTGITVNGAVSTLDEHKNGKKYVYFFKDGGSVVLNASDEGSGVKGFNYTLFNADGTVNKKGTAGSDGVVNIPSAFKGYIGNITVQDNVGNTSEKAVNSDGIVSENIDVAINTNSVTLTTPSTGYRTLQGLPLYPYKPDIKLDARASWSGLNSVHAYKDGQDIGSWGIEDFHQNDDNLRPLFETVLSSSDTGKYDATLVDTVGFDAKTSTSFVVDTTAPVATVTWNQSKSSNIYNSNRVASIKITDANVSTNSIHVDTAGVFSGFHMEGTDLYGTVTYASDIQDTVLKITGADLAGNKMSEYKSETFTIDKTPPRMVVTPSAQPKNGKYYNSILNFNVTVKDANVNASSLSVSGGYARTGWVSSGANSWTTTVSSSGDGEKHLSMSIVDLAGNKGNDYSIDYIQDTIAPQINIAGVTNGAIYTKGSVAYSGAVMDKNIDSKSINMSASKTGSGASDLTFNPSVSETISSNKAAVGTDKKADGYYSVKVAATDLAGNTSEKTVKFIVDRYGGTVKFVSGQMNYLNKLDKDIVLTTTTYIKTQPESFKLSYNLNGYKSDISPSDYSIKEDYGPDGLYTYTITANRKFAQKEGVYDLRVDTVDEAGVLSGSASISYKFVVDNHAPSLYSDVSSGRAHYLGDKYTYSIQDTYGVKDAKFNNTPVALNGVYTVSSQPYALGKNQSFMIVATDNAGNQATYVADNYDVYASFFARYETPILIIIPLLLFILGMFIYIIYKDKHKVVPVDQRY